MLKVGVVSLVTLSVVEAPVSLAEVRSGRPFTIGALVSTTSCGESAAEATPLSAPNTRLEVMLL